MTIKTEKLPELAELLEEITGERTAAAKAFGAAMAAMAEAGEEPECTEPKCPVWH